MDLIPGDVPRPCSHRIRLQRLRAAASSMVDGCFGEGIGDTALPVSRSDENTSHGPDAGIVLSILAALPRRPVDAEEPEVLRTRLHRAPADGYSVEVGDQTAGPGSIWIATGGLGPQAGSPLLLGERRECLSRSQLVPLAIAAGGGAT